MTTARSRPALRLAVASGIDLASAIDAFLSQPDLAATTRAKYRQTLAVLEDELGDAPVTGAGLVGVVEQRWLTLPESVCARSAAGPQRDANSGP